MHAFLALVLVVGSAFFIEKEKAQIVPRVRVVPTKLIDAALAGGGGNPKIAPSEDQQKGDTVKPLPPPPEPQKIVQTPPKPQPKLEPRVEPKPEPKPEPVKPRITPDNTVAARTKPEKEKDFEPLPLKPVVRSNKEKIDAQRAAETKERAAKADQLARKFGNVEQSLRSGFTQGTKVDVWGPGGEAYAGYDALVKAVYDDAWEVSDSLTDDDSTAKVKIVIARSGKVVSAYIDRRSGNSLLDKSVQRALDKVKFVAPFPEGSHDEQRTFTINFNLKAKRLLG
ncbi:MAG TPA: energy transducer TonB [Candidatus Binatia bacterium]|nr:energy transducer TonB [Candidatus Binatia bacterium]